MFKQNKYQIFILLTAGLLSLNTHAAIEKFACDQRRHDCVEENFKYSEDNGHSWKDARVDLPKHDWSLWKYFKCSPDVKNCFRAGIWGFKFSFIQAAYSTDYGRSWQEAPMQQSLPMPCKKYEQHYHIKGAECDANVKKCVIHAVCSNVHFDYVGEWE